MSMKQNSSLFNKPVKQLTPRERYLRYKKDILLQCRNETLEKQKYRKIAGYVEHREACELLNIGRERLRQLKNKGIIEIIVPMRYTRPLYSINSILKRINLSLSKFYKNGNLL